MLWIKDIPEQNECFTQAWGPNEDFDSDIWIEVKNRKEPPLPSVPPICKNWIEEASLRDKSDIPGLQPEIIVQVENPDWHQESDQPEFIPRTERLDDHPDIQKKWDNYVEEFVQRPSCRTSGE